MIRVWESTIECPTCKRLSVSRVISCGLPGKMCMEDSCATAWGLAFDLHTAGLWWFTGFIVPYERRRDIFRALWGWFMFPFREES